MENHVFSHATSSRTERVLTTFGFNNIFCLAAMLKHLTFVRDVLAADTVLTSRGLACVSLGVVNKSFGLLTDLFLDTIQFAARSDTCLYCFLILL